jgi:meiotically up-regulated gene 157 (Mug157) protein
MILMDDANVPSLLSAPYLGYTKPSSFVYRNTRKFLLSKDNPTYYVGKLARGIGSPHTSDNYVWPIAMLMQGFTASTDGERKEVLNELLASDPGDHLLHESFNVDDPTKFTRTDFGWPNALFSEYVMTQFEGIPALPVGSTADLDFRSD